LDPPEQLQVLHATPAGTLLIQTNLLFDVNAANTLH